MELGRRDVLELAALGGVALSAGGVPVEAARYSSEAVIETRPEPLAPPLREAMVPSGTARLWTCDTGGAGPALVLVHPSSGSGRVWRYQLRAFVQAGFRVIAFSRRGAAGSDAGDPADKTSAADDLRAVIAHYALKRCYLVATAGGAFTAVDLASASPHLFTGIVLANSLLGLTGGEIDPMVQALQLPALAKLPVEVRELGPAYRAANPQGTAVWLDYARGAAPARPAERRAQTLDSLRAITAPVLLIAGDADLLAPPPLMALFTHYLPHSRLVRLPACGHSGYWEMPGAFNAAIVSFIKAIEKHA